MTSSAFDLSQFGSQVTSLIDPENRIINGAFDFWQRGTSSTANGYLPDRWYSEFSGGSFSQSRQAFTLGDTFGNNNPSFFLRQSVSGQSTAGQYAVTVQNIEGVRNYAGQTITVLGWMRRSSGSGNVAVQCIQDFGTGGSPSSRVFVSPQTVTLTGSWAAFALTFAVPSISGKTLGTNGNDYLQLRFWTSAGSDFNANTNSLGLQTIGVDLWGIHIKLGSQTVDAVEYYRQPELGPELARCQRYYRQMDIRVGCLPWAASNSSWGGESTQLNPNMRAAPTVTQLSTPTYSSTVGSLPNSTTGSSSSVNVNHNTTSTRVLIQNNASGSVIFAVVTNNAYDAEL